MKTPLVILASKSKARAEMLRSAGLQFRVLPAEIDEPKLMAAMKKKGYSAGKIAKALAKEKAGAIAQQHPNALVIGSDQVVWFEGKIISKAGTAAQAKRNLAAMQGKTHEIISSAAVMRGGALLWHHTEKAKLTMHKTDKAFLQQYCEKSGEALLRSAGGYELESIGSWLFSSVRGDYFTILGMPLLPLLGYLREAHGFKP